MLVFQWRGLAEWGIRLGRWRLFRQMRNDPAEAAQTIARLARPGRLTAGLNYYRANLRAFLFRPDRRRVAVPVLGLFSTGDRYLTASQMARSGQWCDAGFEYAAADGVGHWLQRDAADGTNARLVGFLRG